MYPPLPLENEVLSQAPTKIDQPPLRLTINENPPPVYIHYSADYDIMQQVNQY